MPVPNIYQQHEDNLYQISMRFFSEEEIEPAASNMGENIQHCVELNLRHVD